MARKPKPLPEVPEVAPKKAVMGRPTLYRKEYCQRVMELGAQGKSPAQIAHDLGVLRETMIQWGDTYPGFLTALRMAKQAEQNHWENLGHSGLDADKFNALVWKTSMQARFRDDYTEKRINEHTGKDGGPIQTEAKVVDASALSADEREALRTVLMLAKGKA